MTSVHVDSAIIAYVDCNTPASGVQSVFSVWKTTAYHVDKIKLVHFFSYNLPVACSCDEHRPENLNWTAHSSWCLSIASQSWLEFSFFVLASKFEIDYRVFIHLFLNKVLRLPEYFMLTILSACVSAFDNYNTIDLSTFILCYIEKWSMWS